jgi:hypothetical protein
MVEQLSAPPIDLQLPARLIQQPEHECLSEVFGSPVGPCRLRIGPVDGAEQLVQACSIIVGQLDGFPGMSELV